MGLLEVTPLPVGVSLEMVGVSLEMVGVSPEMVGVSLQTGTLA